MNIGSPSPCSSIVGRATMVVAPTVAARHMRRRRGSMSNYVTAIGLDVHARSIKACALNPMTGEVVRLRPGLGRRVGALLRVAQGGLRVRRHRLPPLPRPARPRPRLRGGRRLQDAAPRRRPRPQGRPARRGVPREASRHAQRRRGVGARRAHRGGFRSKLNDAAIGS